MALSLELALASSGPFSSENYWRQRMRSSAEQEETLLPQGFCLAACLTGRRNAPQAITRATSSQETATTRVTDHLATATTATRATGLPRAATQQQAIVMKAATGH